MKKALVTGGCGWLGSELVEELLKKNYYVKVMDRSKSDRIEELKKQFPNQIKYVIGDLVKVEEWAHELKEIDTLFHLAAKVHVKPKNKEEEKEFFLINRDASNRLFDKALEQGVSRTLFVSTVAVYGESNGEIVNVHSERNPVTPYGQSKNEAEQYALKLYKEKQFSISIAQPVTVYGGQDRGNFRKLYNLAKKGFLVQFGNGENKKTVIYYKDLIQMFVKIAEDERAVGKTYICGTESISYNEIVKHYQNEIGNVKLVKVPMMIAKMGINVLNMTGIAKLKNLAANVNTLMVDNVYEVIQIDNDEYIQFNRLDCKSEYN